MRFSEKWLREWVNPAVDTATLGHQITMAGLEVDSIELAAPEFNDVVVAEVLSVDKHPDADRLNVCTVDVGQTEPLQIVCGASNVAQGVKVPAALVGAKLPGGLKIKKGKLRGVPSLGMLCSAVEIGMAESADGLLILPSDAPVGENIRDFFDLDDRCIEVDLTPNRSDCFSIRGIAREVAVLNNTQVTEPVINEVPAASDDSFAITVEAADSCPRYVGRVIKGINSKAETPLWMVERLRRSAIRSISPVVDVTNYVMIELGQPMHGFDLAKVDGGICVRMARQDERLQLLDGKEIKLNSDSLVIADQVKVMALAGIMGGEGTGVTDDTQDVLLESAFFSPTAIAGKARSYGLHTDSSHRFERGVDPALQQLAIERATQLLLDICGGTAGPVNEVVNRAQLPVVADITLRSDRIKRVLGVEVAPVEVERILSTLGMKCLAVEGGWNVSAPSFRFDINIEEDLIEEVGRIFGYDNLPVSRPSPNLKMELKTERQLPVNRLRQIMVDRGYQEAITYSFVDPEFQLALTPESPGVKLANPISSDMSVMRTTLWSGLLPAFIYNANRQQERIRLFEVGRRFVEVDGELTQESVIAGVVSGELNPEQWAEQGRKVDFFDIKGDVEALLSAGGIDDANFIAQQHPALHPGQSASIHRGEQLIGWVGKVSPLVAKQLDLPAEAYLFELSQDALTEARLPAFSELSKFPSIRRDIALLVDEDVSVQSVQDCIESAASSILKELKLFDIYTGKGIDYGKKSLAIALNLQDDHKTLTDEDVEVAVTKILDTLSEKLNAKLRE
ncbi:Phenylalanyl-tRNA synthetase beta chain [hydrothermal vent metagenome]|uniref:Phenylalanine--tRNA ligase beta subunit n=1 Tax=hydrothermal vent metagenome TaxID=652676 RepID=A0A3B0ZGN2_9ZZZZ